jgi:hypothetical protein
MSAAPTTTQGPIDNGAGIPAHTGEQTATVTANGHNDTTAPRAGGAVDDADVAHWKNKINTIFAKPGDHINQKSPESARPWSSGFFDCFNPIDLCLITYFVPCVTFGKTHHRMRKNANLEGYEPVNTSVSDQIPVLLDVT